MEDPLWRGLSVVDLAVQSQSYKFLETCCPQVLPTRMPYTQMHMYVYCVYVYIHADAYVRIHA